MVSYVTMVYGQIAAFPGRVVRGPDPLHRDYPMIMAVVLVYGAFLALMNLVVDLLYGTLDPRIRY